MDLDTVREQLSSGLGLWTIDEKWAQKEDVQEEPSLFVEPTPVMVKPNKPARPQKSPSILQQILEAQNAEFAAYPRRFRTEIEKYFSDQLKDFITDRRVQSYLGGVCTRGTMSYLTNPHSADPISFLKVMSFLCDMSFEWNEQKITWNMSNTKTILIKP